MLEILNLINETRERKDVSLSKLVIALVKVKSSKLLRNGSVRPCILSLVARLGVKSQLHALVALSPVKTRRYTFYNRLHRPQG